MKLQSARLGVLLAALVGLLAITTPPVSASWVKTVVFSGRVQTWNGLGYPGMGPAGPDLTKIPCVQDLTVMTDCLEVKTDPKGEPIVNMKPDGNHAEFWLDSHVCVKTSVPIDFTKKFPGPAFCAIVAYGAVWGFCGLATGFGYMTLWESGNPIFTGTSKGYESYLIKLTDIGGVWHVTGGSPTRHLYANIMASVDSFDGSTCTNKTEITWYFEGEAVLKEITQ